ncbi:hypothetical protein [uncultured Bartonella sp.]|uniref:hypothetical protein n=1 Tax=uncultured Bartonella sp. TaxID=104108 RepID=UPI0025F783C9|nr:hypothetical protein [uncultured Bartonella sp.]
MAIQSGVIFVASHTLIRIIFSGLIARAKQLFRQSCFNYPLRLFSKQKSLEVFFLHLLKQRERKNDLLKQRYSDCEKGRNKKSKTEKTGTENICNCKQMVTNAFLSRIFFKAFSSSLFFPESAFFVLQLRFFRLEKFPNPRRQSLQFRDMAEPS